MDLIIATVAIGAAAFIVVCEVLALCRAKVYEKRGYKVTHPNLLEWLKDPRPLVEVPINFTEHKWLDSGLRFSR